MRPREAGKQVGWPGAHGENGGEGAGDLWDVGGLGVQDSLKGA